MKDIIKLQVRNQIRSQINETDQSPPVESFQALIDNPQYGVKIDSTINKGKSVFKIVWRKGDITLNPDKNFPNWEDAMEYWINSGKAKSDIRKLSSDGSVPQSLKVFFNLIR